jgi:hypothetical protein
MAGRSNRLESNEDKAVGGEDKREKVMERMVMDGIRN